MSRTEVELLRFLPEAFVWPTLTSVSPSSVIWEWGHRDSFEEPLGTNAVWFVAYPERVIMNANFLPDWPDCGAAEFDASTAAEWLKELTKGWEWGADHDGAHSSSWLRRG